MFFLCIASEKTLQKNRKRMKIVQITGIPMQLNTDRGYILAGLCDVPAALSLSTPKNNQTAGIQNNQFSTFRTDRNKKQEKQSKRFF